MGEAQMNSNPLAKDFSTGSLLKFAFPTISMMLFMGLYTIVAVSYTHLDVYKRQSPYRFYQWVSDKGVAGTKC